jgi:hypothetical protein
VTVFLIVMVCSLLLGCFLAFVVFVGLARVPAEGSSFIGRSFVYLEGAVVGDFSIL